jgi:hypothetical protein
VVEKDVVEVLGRHRVDLAAPGTFLPTAVASAAVLQLNPGTGGQHLQCLREVGALNLLDEVDQVATLAAAEAVPNLLFAADGEARGLLAMEGAQALVVAAGPLQSDVTRDHLDDVETILDLTNGVPLGHVRE